MNIKHYILEQLNKSLKQFNENICSSVTVSTKAQFGHYQINTAMQLAKSLKKNPIEIAELIVSQLDLSLISQKIEIVKPGFINIFISSDFLKNEINKINQHHNFGILNSEPKTIIVDYSSPNLAKEMHVGHLRSTIIGDAMANIFDFLGHNVIRQNHAGDWGTAFGMLIAHLEDKINEGLDLNTLQLSDVEKLYKESKTRFDNDLSFANKSRLYVVKLQQGDTYCLKLWKKFIDFSINHSQQVYNKLNVSLNKNNFYPESSYNDMLPNIVEHLINNNIAFVDQGAIICKIPEQEETLMIQKTDGGFLYSTTDLAACKYRSHTLNADSIFIFTDSRQNKHFYSVEYVARKAHFLKNNTIYKNVSFGMVLGEDGKPFRSRDGNNIKLMDLLDESIERSKSIIFNKNPDYDHDFIDSIAKKIGIGAVKFADLSKNRNSDYIFNWDNMLSFEGYTSPYLQYAYARIQSIFSKANIDENFNIFISNEFEFNLCLKLNQFEETLHNVCNDNLPHLLCQYLYELSVTFMSFYENCPILKDDISYDNQQNRLKICQLVSKTLKQGLNLLGIETINKM